MPKPNGKTILIVEDETPLRNALADILVFEGFNVLLSGDGKMGLETAAKYKPDLIVLDLIMPVMSGWAMLKELRGIKGWGETVPVFLLTNVGEEAASPLAGPNTDHLVKSNWILDDVMRRIKAALGLAGE